MFETRNDALLDFLMFFCDVLSIKSVFLCHILWKHTCNVCSYFKNIAIVQDM